MVADWAVAGRDLPEPDFGRVLKYPAYLCQGSVTEINFLSNKVRLRCGRDGQLNATEGEQLG